MVSQVAETGRVERVVGASGLMRRDTEADGQSRSTDIGVLIAAVAASERWCWRWSAPAATRTLRLFCW